MNKEITPSYIKEFLNESITGEYKNTHEFKSLINECIEDNREFCFNLKEKFYIVETLLPVRDRLNNILETANVVGNITPMSSGTPNATVSAEHEADNKEIKKVMQERNN